MGSQPHDFSVSFGDINIYLLEGGHVIGSVCWFVSRITKK